MKLKIDDIKIRNHSERLSDLINTKFETIEDFAAAIMRSVSTVKKYVKEPASVPEEIKVQITQMFDKEYDEILLSTDEQISRWVGEITENISQYKEESDLETLKALKTLCIEKNNKIEIGKMYRNIGMCYYYNNKPEIAVEMLLVSIDTLSTEDVLEFQLKCKSELCLVYYYDHNYKKAESLFEAVDFLINQYKCADSKTVFLHNYRWGTLYNNTARTKLARSKFQKALTYAPSRFDMGNATMNIGLSYKKDRQFAKALKYYDEALGMFDAEDYLNRSSVYNNIADLYKENNKLTKAMEYINIAMDLLDERDKSKLFIFSTTYIQIKILQGDDDNSLARLFDLLMITKSLFLFRKYAIEAINIILASAKEKSNIKVIKSLSNAVISMVENAEQQKYNEEFIKELKACLGDIYMCLYIYEYPSKYQRR